MIADTLSDDTFVDKYLSTARSDLNISYAIVTSGLTSMGLEYVDARAGIFVFADFSPLLSEQTWKGEEILVKELFEECKVVMTPGESTRAEKPGMFRICYAWVAPEVLQVAMDRLKKLSVAKK